MKKKKSVEHKIRHANIATVMGANTGISFAGVTRKLGLPATAVAAVRRVYETGEDAVYKTRPNKKKSAVKRVARTAHGEAMTLQRYIGRLLEACAKRGVERLTIDVSRGEATIQQLSSRVVKVGGGK